MTMFARILFVDDDAAFREVVESHLAAEGFHVTCANTGTGALEQLKKSHFDVVLLDYHMPDMNGVEVLQRMKELSIRTRVVMLTGETALDKAIETLKLGVDDYLTKPYFAQHLVACINRVIAKGVQQPHLK